MSGQEAWRGDFASVRLETHPRPDGRLYEQTVITVGSGAGVMVIPLTEFDGEVHVGLVHVARPTNGGTTGLEFPRGGCPTPSVGEAARVLARETGLRPLHFDAVGSFHPENGMVDLVVGVYSAAAPAHTAAAAAGFTDPDTGAVFGWHSAGEFQALVRRGKVTDAMTLAAVALLTA